MKFEGFGFSGYRSTGDKLVEIAPIKKINFIIGKNNTGKSNIVLFLKNHLEKISNDLRNYILNNTPMNPSSYGFVDLDRHKPEETTLFKVSFPLKLDEAIFAQYLKSFHKIIGWRFRGSNRPFNLNNISEIIRELFFRYKKNTGKNIFWFNYIESKKKGSFIPDLDLQECEELLDKQKWFNLWQYISGQSQGNIREHWIPDSMKFLSPIPNNIPPVELIPAIRKIVQDSIEAHDYSGIGIIDRLAKHQNPEVENQDLKIKFKNINEFLRRVLENDGATIEIPHNREMILIHMDGKTLPLIQLGTGVHEVIILAVAATLLDKSILCVEEPELHLHPLLQKKLIQYLKTSTTNQYIFTTHSAHLLDTIDAEVFHVDLISGQSIVRSVTTTKSKYNICQDLGYRASDLFQSNCIIWVEGPSDRIYLNKWISTINNNFTEGIHYSIMYYGGSIFSHLTANDPEEIKDDIDEFISVRRMNRNAIIIFDSDKSSPEDELNKTKIRLMEEFDEGPGFSWATEGREIENYIDSDIIEKCVKAVHPSADKILKKGQWSNLLRYRRKDTGEKKEASKIKVARYYIENNEPDFSKLDLREKINALCKFICESNGLNS